jgi:hypothetical protein
MVALIEALVKAHNGSQDLAVDGAAVDGAGAARPPPAQVEGVPPLEDSEEPLHLVKDILGEEKTKEIKEGRQNLKDPEGDEWEES